MVESNKVRARRSMVGNWMKECKFFNKNDKILQLTTRDSGKNKLSGMNNYLRKWIPLWLPFKYSWLEKKPRRMTGIKPTPGE